MSGDGRLVAFVSKATNLVLGGPGDQKKQVFVRDLAAGMTEVVSVSASEVWGNNDSVDPHISTDGRYVAFTSLATNLGEWAGDVNVFVRDRALGTTTLVTKNAAGEIAGGGAPGISHDGRLITFAASNAQYGPPANGGDVFVKDGLSGGVTRVSVSHDALNRATSVIDPRGKTRTTLYDPNGNPTAITTPLGLTQTYIYDADDRLVASVEPRGNVAGATPADYQTSYTYDAAGHRLSVTDPLGNQTRYEYDRAGGMVREIDPLGHATTTTFDALDRISAVATADTATTSYNYDTAGDLISRTDALGHTTGYTYDVAGRQIRMTSPLGQVWNYTYDAADNLTQIVDAAGNATGDPTDGITSYAYDALDRRTVITFSDPATADITYSYDAAGNRISMSDGAGVETRAYNDAGRLTQIIRGTSVLVYEYDAAGNITKRTYPDATQVAAGYDDDGRLANITQGAASTNYSYDAAANPTTVNHANGTVESRTYDRAGRVSEIRHTRGGTTLTLAGYLRDAADNPTGLTTLEGTVTYSYDVRNRLIEACYTATCTGVAADGGDAFIRYSYDGVGNRLTQTRPLGATTYTYNTADQLTQAQAPTGTVSYAYDANGNQTRAGTRVYSYDQVGRLTASQDVATTVTYAYDGDGKRIQATTAGVPAQTTRSTWDPNNPLPELILEQDAAGTLIRRHIHGHKPLTTTSADPLNPALTRTSTLHADALGSTLAVTDAAGETDWRYRYQPYGETRTETRDDLLAPENRIRYTGQHLDLETGLYHLRARQYESRTGRFLTPDPLPRSVGEPYISSYTYADNQPTVLVDPAGLRGQSAKPGFVAPPIVVAPKVHPIVVLPPILAEIIRNHEWIEDKAGDAYDWLTRNRDDIHGDLWRAGNNTDDNFTPRPDRDVRGWPSNGLSTYTTLPQACKEASRSKRAQQLSIYKLNKIPGIRLVPDLRKPGHVLIVGSTLKLHQEWASTRESGLPHRLTSGVRGTIIDQADCR